MLLIFWLEIAADILAGNCGENWAKI